MDRACPEPKGGYVPRIAGGGVGSSKNMSLLVDLRAARFSVSRLLSLVCAAAVPTLALRGDAVPDAPPNAVTSPAPASPEAGTGPKVAKPGPGDAVGDLITFTTKYDQVVPFLPGPYDPNVARLTSQMLMSMHYARHPLDEEYAQRFYDRYLDILDPQRFHFTQGDLKEFAPYATQLAELTVQKGDTRPANEIFARFLERLDQRVALVAEMLKQDDFDFTTDERYTPNRKDAAWPADLTEAQALWRKHLRYEYLQEKLNKAKPEEITDKLAKRYKRLLRTVAEFDRDDVLQFYLTALANAYDPHSDYMGKDQLENFAISMKLALFGIGALLRSDDGYCTIESLTPNGPAERSKKLKPKDRIIAVQQDDGEPVDVVDMKLNKVVDMIRGPKGTEVTLTIIPADAADSSERRTLTLVRDEIKLEDQEAKGKLFELPAPDGSVTRLGLIDLPSFYASFDLGRGKDKPEPRSPTDDVARLITKLLAEGAQGIVLDLRRNGGGSLEEAIRLTGLFIKDGPVVQIRDADGDIHIESDTDPEVFYDGPLLVLVSRFSASASEILAAALQDHGRALIVGDKSTHGKGTVQTVYELNKVNRRFPPSYNPGALKVTIRKFYRANGESTQLRGMTPDVILPSVANELEVGEGMHEFPMPWDTIETAEFNDLNRVRPLLPELRRRSEARIATDPDWGYVREDITLYREAQADKSVSLNYEQRLKERDEAESRSKARKTERAAREVRQETVYELTLKLAGQPGLPPAVGSTNAPIAQVSTTASVADEDEAAEDPASVVDVPLKEAKRILLDLIELAGRKNAPNSPPVAAQASKVRAQGGSLVQ